jgi:hypothetical protein
LRFARGVGREAQAEKLFTLKSFDRLVACSPAPAFRCIQKSLRRHDLAIDLFEPRSAVQLPLCFNSTVLMRWKITTQSELKPNRHMSVIYAA